MRQVGVQEELLVDPVTGRLTAVQEQAVRLQGADDPPVEAELYLQQIETQTPPTKAMDELGDLLRASRRAAGDVARRAGAAAVAIGTKVLLDPSAPSGSGVTIAPKPRSLRIQQEYAELALAALGTLALPWSVTP